MKFNLNYEKLLDSEEVLDILKNISNNTEVNCGKLEQKNQMIYMQIIQLKLN